jgi:hypothetical protein
LGCQVAVIENIDAAKKETQGNQYSTRYYKGNKVRNAC